MYDQITDYVEHLRNEEGKIPQSRRQQLQKISRFIRDKQREGKPAQITFICTHNSRRSHLCQIWAATAAHWAGVSGIQTYSGGTEVTAFNPRAVAAVERAGFRVDAEGGDNPRYQVYFAEGAPPVECYSKLYDAPENPQADFAAVMTCSSADQNCPFIPGAFRVSIPYTDPKEADGTPKEAEVYDERCRQIAREMVFMMDRIAS